MYADLFWMTFISIIVSYFILANVMLTFTNGVYNTLLKVYMAILMGAVMAIIMLVIMIFRMRYLDFTNALLLLVSIGVSLILIALIRRQSDIDQTEFSKAMIEHHDMALLMASNILRKPHQSPAVYSLAQHIYTTQSGEIKLMQSWLNEGFPSSTKEVIS